jgi:hypothetical protein
VDSLGLVDRHSESSGDVFTVKNRPPHLTANVPKNYNSGKTVSDESMAYARPVTVMPVHDQAHPSTLYVPLGQSGGAHLSVSSRSQPSTGIRARALGRKTMNAICKFSTKF